MAEIWLLCEGRSDVPILEAVLTRVLLTNIIPKPVGGGTSAASVAQFIIQNESNSTTVAYVVDRDYRQKSIAERMFTDGKAGFMWRRHAVESYLLEPAVIVEALKRIKESVASNPGGGPAWVKSLPEDVGIISTGLLDCAKARAPQEAGRIALQRLWEDLSETAGRIQKITPPALSTGSPDAIACRQALLDDAARIIAKAEATVVSTHLSPLSLKQRYDDELARISAQTYTDNMSFLEEFHGKDLLSSFHSWLGKEHRSKLRHGRFIQELEIAVPIVYRMNRAVYKTDDFLDLANAVLALAKMPPIR